MSLPNVIGLSGVARAGKDTVADILHSLYGYEVLSFSDALNTALVTLDPWVDFLNDEGEKRWAKYSRLISVHGYTSAKEIPEVRRLLQVFGTEVGRRMFGEDVWVDALFRKVKPGIRYAITNVRFPNEWQATKDRGGEVWRITRPGYAASNGHISDTALDDYTFDHYLTNDGTIYDLSQKVMHVLHPLQMAYYG